MSPEFSSPQPSESSTTSEITPSSVERRIRLKLIGRLSSILRKSGAVPLPIVEAPQAQDINVMDDPRQQEDISDDPTLILPVYPEQSRVQTEMQEDNEGTIIFPEDEQSNYLPVAARAKHPPKKRSNRRYILESMRSEADSYFKARTPYSRRGKIIDEISKITDAFKKGSEDENAPDKPKKLNLFESSPSEDQAKMTAFLEASTSRIEQIRKDALDSQEKVLEMRYGFLPVKFMTNSDITKIRKEIMEYQKKITQLSALYGGEANLSKPDTDKYVENIPMRRLALKYGQAIDTRLRILAAIAGEPYFTPEQANELLKLESEAKKIRDEILVSRPAETITTDAAPQPESIQNLFNHYFENSWLSNTLTSIAQEARQRIQNKRLTPSEMLDIKEGVVGETLDEILARDPSTTAHRAQLKAELEKIFLKHL